MRKVNKGGGWPAVFYTWRKAREVGGLLKLWKAMRSKNACKTCALGMGGQSGGMVNEAGHFPEVCKKSLQAMASDMQGGIRADFFETYSVPQLQAFSPRELESCGRLTSPVVLEAGSQYYRPITWGEALTRITQKLTSIAPRETFWYLSGRSSNEAAFLLQLFARLFGTNNVNNCSYYCHQASGVGLTTAIGASTATVSLADVEGADLIFVIGGNPASNHPRLMRTLLGARRNGAQIVVINPVIETGMVNFAVPQRRAQPAVRLQDCHALRAAPHRRRPGLAHRHRQAGRRAECLRRAVFSRRIAKVGPSCKHTCAPLSWEEIVAKSGVERQQIDELARLYAASKRAVFSWTMGITHHLHGVANVQAIANLALLARHGRTPNAGLLPIRGHSNVQGIGSVGVTPRLKDAILERLESQFGCVFPPKSDSIPWAASTPRPMAN